MGSPSTNQNRSGIMYLRQVLRQVSYQSAAGNLHFTTPDNESVQPLLIR